MIGIYYCLGFILSRDFEVVMLIKKSKGPHSGKWNGVGGHIEQGEPAAMAMARECWEEAGIYTKPEEWAKVGMINDKDGKWGVNVYAICIDSRAVPTLDKVSDEYDDILKIKISELSKLNLAPHTGAMVLASIEKLKNPSTEEIVITNQN